MESGRLWSGCQVRSEAESLISLGTVTVPSCLHLSYRPSTRQSPSGPRQWWRAGRFLRCPSLIPVSREGGAFRSRASSRPRGWASCCRSSAPPRRSPLRFPGCLSHGLVSHPLFVVFSPIFSPCGSTASHSVHRRFDGVLEGGRGNHIATGCRSGCPPGREPVPQRQALMGREVVYSGAGPLGGGALSPQSPLRISIRASLHRALRDGGAGEFLVTSSFSALLPVVSVSSPACVAVQLHVSLSVSLLAPGSRMCGQHLCCSDTSRQRLSDVLGLGPFPGGAAAATADVCEALVRRLAAQESPTSLLAQPVLQLPPDEHVTFTSATVTTW